MMFLKCIAAGVAFFPLAALCGTLERYVERFNAEDEEKDPDSVLNFYRALIRLRTASDIARDGDYKDLAPLHPRLYMYERRMGERSLLVICSFSDRPLKFRLPGEFKGRAAKLVLGNYGGEEPEMTSALRPRGVRIYELG